MTANANNGWCPELPGQLPPGGVPGMAAGEQAGQGQLLTYNSAGYITLVTGVVPGLVSAGVANVKLSPGSPSNAVAGQAKISVWTGYGSGAPASEETSDNFTITDTCTPAWGASSDALGRLSNFSGSNRPLMGLVLGLSPFCAEDSDGASAGTPRAWVGPVAQAVARGLLMAGGADGAALLGQHTYAVDAGAGTDLTEVIFSSSRAKYHGIITAIEYIPNATLGADATNYKTLTVTKYDSNGANGVVVGTLTTVLGFATKWKAYAFTLSVVAHALEVLEGDNFTIQNSHAVSGAVTPAGVIRVVGKVI